MMRSMTIMATLLFGLAAISVLVAAQPSVAKWDAEVKQSPGRDVSNRSEDFEIFDWNLYKKLAERDSGNMIISPISVKLALVLLLEGSQGRTAKEIASALHLPNDRTAIQNQFTSIIRSLQTVHKEYTLDIATRLIVQPSVRLTQRYISVIKDSYSADVSMGFDDTNRLKNEINDWASNATHGHITELISDEGILVDMILIVMNALYFMGTWDYAFPKESTKFGPFFTDADKSVNVSYMNTVGVYGYADYPEVDSQILRLPYAGGKYAMYIVLPRTRTGLKQLMSDINPVSLRGHTRQLQYVRVKLSIPKFNFKSESDLKEVLHELGICDIFGNSTGTFLNYALEDFEGPDPIVTSFLQKSGVEVDEKGTIAYAVTLVGVVIKSGFDPEIINLHIKHPFLFFIEDESTGTLAFIGKVTNPLE